MTLQWCENDDVGCSKKWLYLKKFGTKGILLPRPPFVPTVCQESINFAGMGGLGLLLPWSLTGSGLWPHPPKFTRPGVHSTQNSQSISWNIHDFIMQGMAQFMDWDSDEDFEETCQQGIEGLISV